MCQPAVLPQFLDANWFSLRLKAQKKAFADGENRFFGLSLMSIEVPVSVRCLQNMPKRALQNGHRAKFYQRL